ncbi:MAG TPA: TolC family protein [Tepidisphaeraceae bacterium]|jgi:outer membrane protein TolC|nr:TolC family protein [Tepidisphaeraceae bacterium]
MKPKNIWMMVLLAGAGLVSGCGFSQPPPFDPRRIEQIQIENAREERPQELPVMPNALEPAMNEKREPTSRPYLQAPKTYGKELSMTLQEAIHRAVVNSLEVRVAGYQAGIDEARILEAESRFDPTLFAEGQIQRSYPQGIGGGALDPLKIFTQSLSGGIKQNLTTGGQMELKYEVQRTASFVRPPQLFTPATTQPSFYQNDLTLSITQPLLRDFGAAANLARITIARNDYRISLLDFRKALEDQLQKVEETYWKLVLAQREVEIQKRLMDDTGTMLDLLVNRMGARIDVSDVQVSQARATLEQRNVDLVRQRYQITELTAQLKVLMNDPDLPPTSQILIVPTDAPVEDPINYELSDQIETGLQNRLELMQQSLRIDSAGTVVKAAENNVLPQLNITAQIGLEGLGFNFDDAVKSQSNTDFITYGLGFQFEAPIGNRQARAIYQRTLIQRQQAIDQWRLAAEQVAADVVVALNNQRQAWQVLVAARRSKFAAEDALKYIELREQAREPLTPTFVELKLSRQAALADAERQEIQAAVAYNVALEAMEKAKGTLLRYNNVVMKEEKGPMFMKMSAIKEKKEKKKK